MGEGSHSLRSQVQLTFAVSFVSYKSFENSTITSSSIVLHLISIKVNHRCELIGVMRHKLKISISLNKG